jgi:hypothetical protein
MRTTILGLYTSPSLKIMRSTVWVRIRSACDDLGCDAESTRGGKQLALGPKRGVKIELCGATAKAHGCGNEDLLPDIKVNTDAMARTTQLVQQGFVKITE